MSRKILFAAGFLMLAIPILLQIWDSKKQENVVATYWEAMDALQDTELEKALESAKVYNEELYRMSKILAEDLESENPLEEEYENMLNLSSTGVMGTLEIPQISLKLPVYHGTTEEVLAKGIGHLEESSLPVGGADVHSVLTGHCGLPGAQLFTRLDELEEEDIFFIRVCKEVLAYKVKTIRIVKPEEVEVLEIEGGKDLVSLITCTPYGLNTHRLVVTGERMEGQKEEIAEMEKTDRNPLSVRDRAFIGILCFFLLTAIWRWCGKRKKRIACLFFMILLLKPQINTHAAEGSVEVVVDWKRAEHVQFIKVADWNQGMFVLKKEYKQSGINLNTLETASEFGGAALRLEKMTAVKSYQEMKPENGTVVSGLEEGAYLFRIQGDGRWEPVLVYIPTDSGEESMQYDITLIPKYSESTRNPETGWQDGLEYYIILCIGAFLCVLCNSFIKINK